MTDTFTSSLSYGIHLAAEACKTCDYDCFFKSNLTQAQQCQIAQEFCFKEGKYDQYNFYYVLFCWLNGNSYIFVPVALFIIYLIFGFVSATVEEYIAGGITYCSEALELSEALAAVTLLALANGAGDVITAIVASGQEGGVSYNVGALYGAGFFVCSMVIALTIYNSTDIIKVDKATIFRDVGFYIFSTIVTIVYAYQGTIYTWSAILLLVIYFLMVLAVYIQDKLEQQERDKAETLNAKQEIEKYSLAPKKNHPLTKLKTLGANVLNKIKIAKIMNTIVAKKRLLKQATLATDPDRDADDEDDEKSFSEMNNFLRKITMPPSEKEKFEKTLCIIWPFPGLLFILYATGQLTLFNYLTYCLPISFITSMIFYNTQKDLEEGEVPSYFFWISIISTIVGLIWTYIGCAMLMDLLNTFIVLFRLNQTYMGLTVLGVGNALPDALTTVALAKKGYAQMGITGSYAGQLFGLLIGFGLAQLKTTILNGPQDFSLFEKPADNLLDIVVIGFAFINLLITAIYGIMKDYTFEMGLAYIVGFLYISFFVVATVIQIYYVIEGIN